MIKSKLTNKERLQSDITDRLMIAVKQYIADNDLNFKLFGELIGLDPTYFSAIRSKRQSFQNEHMAAIGKVTGVNMNFVFGLSHDVYVKRSKPISQQLSEISATLAGLNL